MDAVGVAFEQTEVDGIPVFWAEAPPPFTAALVFRVGRSDESLPTAGLTHLVEHLALFPIGRTAFFSNGMVDDSWTSFFASGTRDEALGFLRSVAKNLREPPLERLATEKRILMTEDSSGNVGSHFRLMNLRFGARNFGLSNFQELGLRRLDADDVALWAQDRFVRENAAVWMTGPPGDQLELELASGNRASAFEPSPLRGLELPAQISDGSGGVAVGLVGHRSTALSTGAGLAVRRAHSRLRLDTGLSYNPDGTYQPLTADLAHLTIGADCLDEHAAAVRDELLAVLRALAEEGPTEDELQEARAERARSASEPAEARGWLDYAAREVLMSGRPLLPEQILAELEALTAGEVAEALAEPLSGAIVLAPTRTPRPPGFAEYGTWPYKPVHGRSFRQTPLKIGRNVKVVASDEGVTLYSPEQTEPITVRFDECAAVLRWSPSRVTLLALDGSWIELRSRTLRRGPELVRHVLERVPEEWVIPMEDVQTPESLIELAGEKLGRTHVARELQLLPEHLLPGERVENLAQLDQFLKRALLVLTDRRLIYISRGHVGRAKGMREVALADIVEVEGTERKARIRGRVTVRTARTTFGFSRFAKRRRAAEFWRALNERATV